MQQLENKITVITGASRGIGESTARLFAQSGAKVVLLARSKERIEALAGEIGDGALAIECDVGKAEQVNDALRAAHARFGAVDILINNAGMIAPMGLIGQVDQDAWGRLIDVNLKGPFHAIHAALPQMIAKGGGTILNIGSGAAHHPLEGWSAYCASKAGLLMLTRMIDKEYRLKGVRSISLSPGTVATQMQTDIKASGIGPVAQLNWEDHIAPDWPARALMWMCSTAADPWLGDEVSLREPQIRQAIGLT